MTTPTSYATQFPHLQADNPRLQQMEDGYLWWSGAPAYYISATERTGQFYGQDGAPSGYYYLQANEFTGTALSFGEEFWLTLNSTTNQYDVNDYADSDPGTRGAVYVPWEHIAQHTYAHITDFNIKEAHTFWPVGTTEAMLLGYLVEALNSNGKTSVGAARIAWESSDRLKTFFLNAPVSPGDRYTAEQMSDLFDLFS